MGTEEELTFGQRMGKKWRGFKKFLWNGDTKEFLGRGGKSWAKISLFYLIFYICLAAFWACMLLVFMQTVDYNRPKWVSYVSTPGLVVTPSAYEERISYTPNNDATYKKHLDAMKKVWDSLAPEVQGHTENCDPITEPGNKTAQRFCSFDRTRLGQFCTEDNKFGYDTASPCIFVNLNRVWGWIPEDPETIPEDKNYTLGNILISCAPYKEKDSPGVNGTQVYPPEGLPFAYYPYVIGTNKKMQALYISPYVAVRVHLNEEFAVGRDIKVQCKAFTGNIEPRGGLYDTKEQSEFTIIFNLGKREAPKDEM